MYSPITHPPCRNCGWPYAVSPCPRCHGHLSRRNWARKTVLDLPEGHPERPTKKESR